MGALHVGVVVLALFVLCAKLQAQTNANTPATTNAVVSSTQQTNSTATEGAATERIETHIYADLAEFDPRTRVVMHRGNVRIEDPRMKAKCDVLTATMGQDWRPENIVAEGNVVIDAIDEDGQTNHATGGKLVYTFEIVEGKTNEIARLTVNPSVITRGIRTEADEIIWDRSTGKYRAAGNIHSSGLPPAAAADESLTRTNKSSPNER
jgi:lipopolysaccharide export system protein LptA